MGVASVVWVAWMVYVVGRLGGISALGLKERITLAVAGCFDNWNPTMVARTLTAVRVDEEGSIVRFCCRCIQPAQCGDEMTTTWSPWVSTEVCEEKMRRRERRTTAGDLEVVGTPRGEDTTARTDMSSTTDRTDKNERAVDKETVGTPARTSPGTLAHFVPTAALQQDLRTMLVMVGVLLAAVLVRWARNLCRSGMRWRAGTAREDEQQWEDVDRLALNLFEMTGNSTSATTRSSFTHSTPQRGGIDGEIERTAERNSSQETTARILSSIYLRLFKEVPRNTNPPEANELIQLSELP